MASHFSAAAGISLKLFLRFADWSLDQGLSLSNQALRAIVIRLDESVVCATYLVGEGWKVFFQVVNSLCKNLPLLHK